MRRKFEQYSNFCDKCGKYYHRLKKSVDRHICISCYEGNHNLKEHYPELEIKEFLSTTKQSFIVTDEGKIYKDKSIRNSMKKGGLSTEND